ncbi:unnamed protein product [Ilex paraguariensis]|uniref:Serine/threonine-protein phosphatase 6 regulatory subunit 2 n=1 Tax=Ilex paraguariensis TaxID=185542 RepID=A0ABC8RJL5_9AQUA
MAPTTYHDSPEDNLRLPEVALCICMMFVEVFVGYDMVLSCFSIVLNGFDAFACLRERAQVEQLIRYIVEEAPEDSEKSIPFKFPFIACEIFTCEVDIILKTLVEDEELMNLLFSFLEPEKPHSTLLAGYFSKVVICLLLRKTITFMDYIRVHQEIIRRLVDLIGITSIMEVLIRLIGADEHLYSNYVDSMQWLEEIDVLEMIVDKFSSSDCPEVHANAAETLCALSRYAPPVLAAKITSPSFIGRLFRCALEDTWTKSVLVNSLSVCISLLDPKRLTLGTYYMYNRQLTPQSVVTANPETIEGMLESLGSEGSILDGYWLCDLLKLLDVSSEENRLLTTYGKLQPPFGKHRLKIIEFISVLVTVSSEAAEKELIRLGAIKHILELFFEYPYNNFLHHHVEDIIESCLERNNAALTEHILNDCNLVGKILEAEKNFTLSTDPNKPTVPADGRSPPRIGNIGHITHISNKLVQLGKNDNYIQAYLQENSEWIDWHTNTLLKRNAVENVYQWACGRPTALQDRMRDSDDDNYQERDYDVAALANNLSQAFPYGIYSNDYIDEMEVPTRFGISKEKENGVLKRSLRVVEGLHADCARGSIERDDEDVYFDDESAEVVISSLCPGDEQESGSLFTNSNWFALEDDRIVNERSTGSVASPSSKSQGTGAINGSGDDVVIVGEDDDLVDTATSELPEPNPRLDGPVLHNLSEGMRTTGANENETQPEWVELSGSSDSGERSDATSESVEPLIADQCTVLPNDLSKEDTSTLSTDNLAGRGKSDTGGPPESLDDSKIDNSELPEPGNGNPSCDTSASVNVEKPITTEVSPGAGGHEETN